MVFTGFVWRGGLGVGGEGGRLWWGRIWIYFWILGRDQDEGGLGDDWWWTSDGASIDILRNG